LKGLLGVSLEAFVLLGPDGRPRDELFLQDKLHLNPAGYAVWTAALAPVLQQVLPARPRNTSP
jgi:lysophospholipase L1-like esterase